MSQDVFDKILNDHRELSSLPQVLVEVIRISNDEEASVADIASIIMKDPALTARLLRIVNSPYYGVAKKITTVQQAVLTVGIRTVTAVALAASIYDLFNTLKTKIDRKKFWRHSLEVALASRMIAVEAGHEPADEAFVAGLLHDIGSLVLEASYPADFERICKLVESGVRLTSAEEQTWGTNHARVGQFLLDQWALPDCITEAVGNHHVISEQDGNPPEQRLNRIVCLANHISKFRIFNMPQPDKEEFESKQIIAASLNLSDASLGNIEQSSISEVANEGAYLEIDIGSVEEILRDANRLLFRQYLVAEQLLRENMGMTQRYSEDQEKLGSGEAAKKLISSVSQFVSEVNKVMLNRAKAVEAAVADKEIIDRKGVARMSAETIANGTETISVILDELKRLSDPGSLFDSNLIRELEKKINLRFRSRKKKEAPVLSLIHI